MTAKTLRLISCGAIALFAFLIWYIFVPTTLYEYYPPDGPRLKCRLALNEPIECAVLFNDKVGTPDSHRPLFPSTPFKFSPYSEEQPRYEELDFFDPKLHEVGATLTPQCQTIGLAELTTGEKIEVQIRTGIKPSTYNLKFFVGEQVSEYSVGLKQDSGGAAPINVPHPTFQSRFDDFLSGVIS